MLAKTVGPAVVVRVVGIAVVVEVERHADLGGERLADAADGHRQHVVGVAEAAAVGDVALDKRPIVIGLLRQERVGIAARGDERRGVVDFAVVDVAVDELAGPRVGELAFEDFEVTDGFAARWRQGMRPSGPGGTVQPARSRASCCRTWRSWPEISISARRLEMLPERLANSVTTAAIIRSVMAVAISISMRVRPRREEA